MSKNKVVVIDPDNVPVRVVNGCTTSLVGGALDIILTTTRVAIVCDSSTEIEHVIAARLRIDLGMAKRIRDRLDHDIAALTPPPPSGRN